MYVCAGGAKSAAGQALLVERVRRIMAPFILRRLKSEVASQLVAKTHKLLEVRSHSPFLRRTQLEAPER